MSHSPFTRSPLGRALRRLIGASVLVAAFGALPTAALARGGSGSEPIANNLSFPAIWSEGATLTLNGTFGSPQLQTPTVITDPAGNPLTLYLQGDPTNTWQAENTTSTDPVEVSQIDWGDNLESRTFSLNQKIRVETTMLENLATPMLGFTMYSASGSQSTEVFGTDGTTYQSPQATIYSACARLTIQRLEVSRNDPYLSRLTWDPATGSWTGAGLVASPILNSGIWEGGEGGGFAAEINGSGKADYGYNWNTSGLSAGDYRITFSLDPNCPAATLNTFITPLTSIFMTSETEGTSSADGSTLLASESGGGSVAKLDAADNLSYIDVELGTPSYQPYLPPAPLNTAPPTLSGRMVQGQTVTASTGSWDNSPSSYGYQWQRCDATGSACTNITAASAASYRLTSSDVGHTIRVVVTATNIDGSTSARSEASTVVLPLNPVSTAAPRILGTRVKGYTLVATNGSWANGPTSFTYHWQVCGPTTTSCSDIAGATGGRLQLGAAVVGQRVRVRVTATNAGGSTTATSPLTAKIAAKPTAQLTLRLRFRSHNRLYIAGQVRPAHNGRHLLVQRRTANGWKTVSRVTLHGTETGASVYGVTLRRTPGLYRALMVGDTLHRVSASQTKRVRRLAHVTLRLRHLSGDQVRLWGSITPARNGKRLVIQRRVGMGWTTVAKVRLYKTANHRSRYGITLKHPRNGVYRARFGGDSTFRPSSSSPTNLS